MPSVSSFGQEVKKAGLSTVRNGLLLSSALGRLSDCNDISCWRSTSIIVQHSTFNSYQSHFRLF